MKWLLRDAICFRQHGRRVLFLETTLLTHCWGLNCLTYLNYLNYLNYLSTFFLPNMFLIPSTSRPHLSRKRVHVVVVTCQACADVLLRDSDDVIRRWDFKVSRVEVQASAIVCCTIIILR